VLRHQLYITIFCLCIHICCSCLAHERVGWRLVLKRVWHLLFVCKIQPDRAETVIWHIDVQYMRCRPCYNMFPLYSTLAGCSLDKKSSGIVFLSILTRQAKTLHNLRVLWAVSCPCTLTVMTIFQRV